MLQQMKNLWPSIPHKYSFDKITENPNAIKQVISPNKARVEWNPSKKEQKELKPEGLNGQMIVEYDVDASNQTQQILVNII